MEPQTQPKAEPSINYQSQIKFIDYVINNMLSTANKRIMITGDTGLGKTSFVKQFARMMGFPFIVIEIPHVVEENLINIPFVVFDKQGNSSQDYDTFKKDGATIELGTSHLVSSLQRLPKMTDSEYANAVKSFDPYMRGLVEAYEQANPGEIAAVRKKYDRILFFDEYYRQTTPAIRNILRNVLNGRIGNDPIPRGTYVMYASNLQDVGGSIDPQSQHTSFIHKEFRAPSVEQWLAYTVNNALRGNIKIKSEVVQAFKAYLTDERLSVTDVSMEIRSSPRRWSEILLYVNNAYPFKSPQELSILMTTLKRQFQNEELSTSEAYQSLESIIQTLATQSGINLKDIKPVSATQWRDVLAQQVLTAMSVGEQKKYVPVLQGLPGVGKTAIGTIFEQEPYNLRFIPILSTTISRDSIVGIPLSDRKDSKISVKFTEPELYLKIMNSIREAETDYREELEQQQSQGQLGNQTAEQAFAKYEQQRYKYLIFFDEINRVSDVSIFNSLRRLILEREFNDQYKLPKSSVIIAAMNPSDMGTQPLTSHFRDAVDLIDVAPNWTDTLNYLKNQVAPYVKKLNNIGDTAVDVALELIEQFPNSFSTKKFRGEGYQFYINVGDLTEIYISPRDYDNLFRELATGIDRVIKRIITSNRRGNILDDAEVNDLIVDAALDYFNGMLEERLYQAGLTQVPGFAEVVEKFIRDNLDISLTKKTAAQTLGQIFDDVVNDITSLTDDIDFIVYMDNYEPNIYAKDIKNFFIDFYKSTPTDQELLDSTVKLDKLFEQLEKFVIDNNYVRDIFERTLNALADLNKNLFELTDANGNKLYDRKTLGEFIKFYVAQMQRFGM